MKKEKILSFFLTWWGRRGEKTKEERERMDAMMNKKELYTFPIT